MGGILPLHPLPGESCTQLRSLGSVQLCRRRDQPCTHPCTCARDTSLPTNRPPPPPRPSPRLPCLQGVEIGIGIGVGLSLLMVIYKTAFPRITTLGRLPGTAIYRSERMYPEAEPSPGLLILRVDGELQQQQLGSSIISSSLTALRLC